MKWGYLRINCCVFLEFLNNYVIIFIMLKFTSVPVIIIRSLWKSLFELLTHSWSMFPFYTSWKHQKTKGFLVFSEVWNGNIGQECVKLTVRLFGSNSLNHSVRLFETKNSRICQINSRKHSLNNLKYTISPKYFEVYLPQVWLGSFLNTLSHCWTKLV